MAPEAQQVPRGRSEPLVQVIGGHAAAGPAPAAPLEPNHHARAPVALDEPRRDDADDSRVPSLPCDHQRGRVKLGGAGRVGREEDALLGLATVAVEVVELLGDLGGALVVVGQHQLEGGVGAAEAAGGVDAAARAGSSRSGPIQVGRVKRRDAHQRPQARPLGAGQLGQPLPGNATVLVAQRHHVAHRGQAREVEILLGVPGVPPPLGAAPATA